MRSFARPLGMGALLVSAGFVSSLACRRSFDEKPVAALASSSEFDLRFDAIRARWADASSSQRAAMRAELNELLIDLERRGDGLEPLARAYLAIAWLDAGVPAAAEAVARPLVDGPAGVANDLGTMVKGAALRRLGKPGEAIELLRPLVGKLIDAFARPILYEEIAHAFLDEGRWDDAIAYCEGWLRSAAPAEKKGTKAAIAKLLERMPDDVALRVLEAESTAPPEAKHSPDMLLLLSARVEQGGTTGVALLDAGSDGAIAATDAAIDAAPSTTTTTTPVVPSTFAIRFDPRAIALLVPTSASGTALRATAVVRAVASVASPALSTALHDAGTDGAIGTAPSGHRLSVFDTTGTAAGVAKALEAAERDGAAVVIGGATDLEANTLAALAQTRRVAVVLLRRPTVVPPLVTGERQNWIAIGPSSAEERSVAIAATTAADAVIVEPWPDPTDASPPPTDPMRARCDATPKTAGAPAFPVALWKSKKVSTIVVLGDARCARKVAEEVASIQKPPLAWKPAMVVGLSALEIAHVPVPLARTIVSAGALPANDAAPASLRTLWIDQAAPVSFWNGLGHDAAALATAALPGDLTSTELTAEIQKHRATTIARLFAASRELWTTDAKGPAANGVVPRTPSLRGIGPGSASVPSWVPP